MKDYYAILEVTEKATEDKIRKSYRRLAFKYHPDRNPGHETEMKEVNEAFEVLGDPSKRRNYDIMRRQPVMPPVMNPGFQPGVIVFVHMSFDNSRNIYATRTTYVTWKNTA